jgi:hypothetical protein
VWKMKVVTAKMETLIHTCRYAVCVKHMKLTVKYIFPEDILFLLYHVTFEYIHFPLADVLYLRGLS